LRDRWPRGLARKRADARETGVEDQPSSTTFHYDAFISYRHASPDDKIAEALHRALEEYVVPRSLVKRGFPKRLSRVFRDRDELPTSNSLTDGIREALARSRVLIVVCSRRTPGSKWIAKEIEIFKSLGRDGQVLSLLIEGEPEESFPPLLREARQSVTTKDGATSEVVEEISPLAADIRAASVAESLRLLKNEKLRLLAPILGCSFDDLKQRHRQRMLRRAKIATASLLLGIMAAAGAGYWYWDTQARMRTEYYADYVKQWGRAKGIRRLTPEEVSHRVNSLKFYVRGDRVEGFDVINGFGGMTVNNSVDTFIGLTDSSNDARQEFQYKWQYNTDGQVTRESAYDRERRPVWSLVYNAESADIAHYEDKNGYPRPRTGSGAGYVQFTRNAAGYDVQARFTDSKGDPEPNQDGVFGWSHVVDANGLVLEDASLDRDGRLMVNRYGYARETHRYDSMGNEVGRRFFDVEGKPTYDKSGIARLTAAYDRYGQLTEVHYWDKQDKPAVLKGGFCEITYKYDIHGDQVEKVYRNADGKPAAQAEKIARISYSYDERGREIRRSYWQADGKPGKTDSGFYQMELEYDSNGYLMAQSFLDASGHKIAGKNGAARETWSHDEKGNENQFSYFGVDDKPVLCPGGYATMKMKYDAHSNRIEEAYYGVHGEPILAADGYARIAIKYDDRGNEIENDYFDVNGRPVMNTSGYAKYIMVRNEHGQAVETTFCGIDGSPILIHDGFARIVRRRDLRDNQIETVAYGPTGKPRLNKKGFNRVTRSYDEVDNLLEESFWGLGDELVMTTDGYARHVFYYDERRRQIAIEKFDASGKSLGKEDVPLD
jgi:hypothetical protein